MNDWIVRVFFFCSLSYLCSFRPFNRSVSGNWLLSTHFHIPTVFSILSLPRCLSLALVFMRNNYNEYKIKINIYYVCSDTYVCARPSSVIHISFFFATRWELTSAHTVSIEWILYISGLFYCYFNDLVLCVMSHFKWAHWIDSFFSVVSLRCSSFLLCRLFRRVKMWSSNHVAEIVDSQPLITIIQAI